MRIFEDPLHEAHGLRQGPHRIAKQVEADAEDEVLDARPADVGEHPVEEDLRGVFDDCPVPDDAEQGRNDQQEQKLEKL
jgi:hypothetical protein